MTTTTRPQSRSQGAASGAETYPLALILLLLVFWPTSGLRGCAAAVGVMLAAQLMLASRVDLSIIWNACCSQKFGPQKMRNVRPLGCAHPGDPLPVPRLQRVGRAEPPLQNGSCQRQCMPVTPPFARADPAAIAAAHCAQASIGFAQCVRPGGRPTDKHCLDLFHFPGWVRLNYSSTQSERSPLVRSNSCF